MPLEWGAGWAAAGKQGVQLSKAEGPVERHFSHVRESSEDGYLRRSSRKTAYMGSS